MKLTFTKDRLLAVMAHPDDAELLCAGTLARAQAEGAAVAICVLCNGGKGVAGSGTPADLALVRRAEAEGAAGLVSAALYWVDSPDGELFDTRENRLKLVEIFRQFKPTLVLTHAPEDYHPDHRATGTLAEAASWFAASTGHVTASPALPVPPAVWFADTINMESFTPELFVDITPYFLLKQKMLLSHGSQLARGRDANFSPLAELMQRQCQTRGSQSNVEYAECFRTSKTFKRHHAF